jgi:3'(2'), 5'-bisphosphate nucleotidase
MNLIDPCRHLDAVEKIALSAGARILEIYSRAFGVTEKGDGSPLTEADEASHAAIAEGLARLTPEIPVLSEESAEIAFEQRRGWERFWLVDPLDGTKEFIKRNGEFTVNIALIERDRPVLGVVHVPVKGVTYLACTGGGAFKREGGAERRPIRATRFSGGRARIVASRSHSDHHLTEYLARVGEHELVSMGSSLKFCLIAEGAADVYPRLGPTMEWDVGAAHCVVEAAGGRVLAPDGGPLRYNKPVLRNPWIMTCGDGDYDWMRFLPVPDPA